MAWNIFRNKTLKALDTIYKAYDTLHASYEEMSDNDNEIFQHQASLIRSQLYELGAAFDMVIAQVGPSFLPKCHKEYGYIPYTAKSHISRNVVAIIPVKSCVEKAHTWLERRDNTSQERTLLGSRLNKVYIQKLELELINHLEMIEEAKDLGRLSKNITEWTNYNLHVIDELYLFPKEKLIEKKLVGVK